MFTGVPTNSMNKSKCPICVLESTSVTIFCEVHEKVWVHSRHRAEADLTSDESYDAAVKTFIEDTIREESEFEQQTKEQEDG